MAIEDFAGFERCNLRHIYGLTTFLSKLSELLAKQNRGGFAPVNLNENRHRLSPHGGCRIRGYGLGTGFVDSSQAKCE